MEGHGHVVEDSPAVWVGAGGETGAGEARVLQLAGDVVPAALAVTQAAVRAGAARAGLPAGLYVRDLPPGLPVTPRHTLRPQQQLSVPGGERPHSPGPPRPLQPPPAPPEVEPAVGRGGLQGDLLLLLLLVSEVSLQ